MKTPPYTRGQLLPAILEKRIVILDGAMGTMIQRFKLSEAQYRGAGYTGPGSQGDRFKDFHKDIKGNNELLSLTRPDVIQDIHESYLAAGADLIETNTFGATTVAQADYDMAGLAVEMNYASARVARAACDKFSTPDKPRFVVGALGPTPKTASISPDVNDPGARNTSFEALRQAYYEQTEALVKGGSDVLLVVPIPSSTHGRPRGGRIRSARSGTRTAIARINQYATAVGSSNASCARISGLVASVAAHQSTSTLATPRPCATSDVARNFSSACLRRRANRPHSATSSGSGAKIHAGGGTTRTSVRGWRGATCANHVTPSSTMSHCSQ